MNKLMDAVIKITLFLSFVVIGSSIAATLLWFDAISYIPIMQLNTVVILICCVIIAMVLNIQRKKHH